MTTDKIIVPPGERIRSPRAFTLIELLVVIAILAVLVALLLPTLHGAKERSNRVTCMAHERQVAVALTLMAADNNGWIDGINAPLNSTGGTEVASSNYWYYCITNYLGNSDLLVKAGSPACPSKSYPDNFPPYGVNFSFIGGYGGNIAADRIHSLPQVIHPARIFLVCENYFEYPNSPTDFDYTCIGLPWARIATRHFGEGLNFVFVDGHGEWVKSSGQVAGLTGNFDTHWWWGRDTEVGTAWDEYGVAGGWGYPYHSWAFGDWWGE